MSNDFSLQNNIYYATLFLEIYKNNIYGGIYNMARKNKNLLLQEQLVKITKDIENTEKSLKDLKKSKREIESQVKQMRLNELDQLIEDNHLSFDQVKSLITEGTINDTKNDASVLLDPLSDEQAIIVDAKEIESNEIETIAS